MMTATRKIQNAPNIVK